MPKVRLKKRSKVWLEAGETVSVSPADADFLTAVGSAERIEEKAGESAITEQIDKPASISKTKRKK